MALIIPKTSRDCNMMILLQIQSAISIFAVSESTIAARILSDPRNSRPKSQYNNNNQRVKGWCSGHFDWLTIFQLADRIIFIASVLFSLLPPLILFKDVIF